MGANLTYHDQLGSGASGDVFRATWRSEKHGRLEVAAKKIRLKEKDNRQLRQLQCEVDCLKKLNHKNIVKYYDAIFKPSHVIVITEYASKGSLYDYLQDKDCLEPELAGKWMRHLALGIQYIKHNGLVHRDIKSPNCVISADDTLKICDFGIAKPLTSTKTTKSTKGSVKWLAPEVIRYSQLSPKADIYAFGIVVWELNACEVPYKGMRSEHIMFTVCDDNRRPEIPAHCPKLIKELMEKCWDADKDRRPDIDTIVDYIQNHGEELGLKWHLQHEIETSPIPTTVCWIKPDQLVACAGLLVKVYRVTHEGAHLQYTLTSNEWNGGWPQDVAISNSLPDHVFVICIHRPYVYQFPCQQSTEEVKKYQIHDGKVTPWCMASNTTTAVIGLYDRPAIVVCTLPDFTEQRLVQLGFCPFDLSITNNYLVVMRLEEMIVKSLDDLHQDLFKIAPPSEDWEFKSVSFRNDSKQIYVACNTYQVWRGVFKYTLDDTSPIPRYVNSALVAGKLDYVPFRGLSVTTEGLLAVVDKRIVKVYSLE